MSDLKNPALNIPDATGEKEQVVLENLANREVLNPNLKNPENKYQN
jgi:hypothetical protein